MIQYRNLLGVSVTTIYETFLDAFSDYAIPMKPSLAAFQNMLASKGFQADSSVGAFDQSDLVGFILNGERETQVYNLGTGVKVAYRAQKIASGMLDASIRLLFEKNRTGYLLEVLQDNQKAYALYKQKNFEITRHFLCFRLEEPQISPKLSPSIHQEPVDLVADFESTLPYKPSWQNNHHAILALRKDFICYTYRNAGELLGYAVLNPASESLAQLGARSKKVGEALIAHILADTKLKMLGIINVDERDESLIHLLTDTGFTKTFSQYEMLYTPKY
ncbi:GNAT family N-acetyltransferase [Listeria fleischmannii]|uniref:GNAT family N-acetyltransferase n=1 Tax=Listeria fleischmannii TaxID=1069827 RepID=UPI001625A962|nr:GNAT family N-acetyltransferase [Listeria fleischmannii]MBC1417803.1 GNAT family N-acetyltransferase [Listeria fleischmannii]